MFTKTDYMDMEPLNVINCVNWNSPSLPTTKLNTIHVLRKCVYQNIQNLTHTF
jgi:hypothetical protein